MKIIVHTQPQCMPCRAVKRWLDRKLGPDSYVETELTDESRARFFKLGLRATPVVELPGEPPHGGYRPELLEAYARATLTP